MDDKLSLWLVIITTLALALAITFASFARHELTDQTLFVSAPAF